jgi:hypothetical protein
MICCAIGRSVSGVQPAASSPMIAILALSVLRSRVLSSSTRSYMIWYNYNSYHLASLLDYTILCSDNLCDLTHTAHLNHVSHALHGLYTTSPSLTSIVLPFHALSDIPTCSIRPSCVLLCSADTSLLVGWSSHPPLPPLAYCNISSVPTSGLTQPCTLFCQLLFPTSMA